MVVVMVGGVFSSLCFVSKHNTPVETSRPAGWDGTEHRPQLPGSEGLDLLLV